MRPEVHLPGHKSRVCPVWRSDPNKPYVDSPRRLVEQFDTRALRPAIGAWKFQLTLGVADKKWPLAYPGGAQARVKTEASDSAEDGYAEYKRSPYGSMGRLPKPQSRQSAL
jgi:hypothetical protein